MAPFLVETLPAIDLRIGGVVWHGAGVLASIALNAWDLFSYYVLQLADLRMLDWAGMVLYGSIPQTSFQVVSSLAMQLLWSGFRGILFSYLVPDIRSQWYVGKAIIFSLVLSFFESGVTVLYRVPHIAPSTSGTVFSDQIGSLLWGVPLGYLILRWRAGTPKNRVNEETVPNFWGPDAQG